MRKGIFVALVLASTSTTQALSADYPTTGTLSGEVENDGLQYQCELETSQALSCEFTQVSISALKKTSDWPEEKQKVTEQFQGMSTDQRRKEVESICEYSKQLENILAGRTELPPNLSTEPKKSQFLRQPANRHRIWTLT